MDDREKMEGVLDYVEELSPVMRKFFQGRLYTERGVKFQVIKGPYRATLKRSSEFSFLNLSFDVMGMGSAVETWSEARDVLESDLTLFGLDKNDLEVRVTVIHSPAGEEDLIDDRVPF